jgi:hypothetical protein
MSMHGRRDGRIVALAGYVPAAIAFGACGLGITGSGDLPNAPAQDASNDASNGGGKELADGASHDGETLVLVQCGASECVDTPCCLGSRTCSETCGDAGPPLTCDGKTVCGPGEICCAFPAKPVSVGCREGCSDGGHILCDPDAATNVCPKEVSKCNPAADELKGYFECHS